MRIVAKSLVDFRGDEPAIAFIDGGHEQRTRDFLEGGGRRSLMLLQRAVEYLKKNQSHQSASARPVHAKPGERAVL
jgi:hypothetical protein